MRILLGQTNPTPGDWMGNLSQIQDGIAMAVKHEAAMAIFPECAIPGYLVQDKMYAPDFAENNKHALEDLVQFSRAVGPHKPYIIVGYIDRNRGGCGKPFRNMAAVIHDGTIVDDYQKWLLPYNDVFDEGRYYAPGKRLLVLEVSGIRWGIVICEDWWNDKGQDDYFHTENPIQAYRNLGIKHIISINASPYVLGKCARRIAQAKEVCQSGGTFIFLNQRGGSDELVFDGNSFVVNSTSLYHLVTSTDTPHYEIVNLEDRHHYLTDDRNVWEGLYDCYTLAIRDYVRKTGFKTVVLGNSGGVDSALVEMGACDAVGPENVVGVRMPSIYSSDHSMSDGEALSKRLGCRDLVVPIGHTPLLEHINKHAQLKLSYNDVADQNIQARLRAIVLMHLSNAYGWLLLTTGNKTESTFGYCTLGGDMMGGFAPIKDLYKGQVYRLIMQSGKDRVPQNIINKKPSAELKPGQFDENDLLPYPILDATAQAYCEKAIATYAQFHMWAFKMRIPPQEYDAKQRWEKEQKDGLNQLHDMVYDWLRKQPRADYERLMKMAERAEFKRRLSALGPKFSTVAYGSGRRMPLAKA